MSIRISEARKPKIWKSVKKPRKILEFFSEWTQSIAGKYSLSISFVTSELLKKKEELDVN